MKVFWTDKLYEDAARTPEALDMLLKQLQCCRRNGCIVLAILLSLLAALAFSRDPWPLAGFIIALAATELVWVASYDSQVKMLLFLRSQRNSSDCKTITRQSNEVAPADCPEPSILVSMDRLDAAPGSR